MTYRAVFFDAGETLVHPHPSFPDLFASVLRSEGIEVSERQVHDNVHVIVDRFAAAAADNDLWTTTAGRSRAFWHSVYEAFLDQLGIPAANGLHDTLYREFTDLSNYALFDDVVPILERLRPTGIVLGVISNFEEWLERLLEMLGVAGFFDVRVISGIEGVEKPDPAIFRLALERAGVRPEETVYVGDSPAFDVEPARELGMFPVLIDRRGRYPDAASARIASMADLPLAIGLA
ncbi:MAG: HAD-IA family hydrolase [Actinomycetota bacterium]